MCARSLTHSCKRNTHTEAACTEQRGFQRPGSYPALVPHPVPPLVEEGCSPPPLLPCLTEPSAGSCHPLFRLWGDRISSLTPLVHFTHFLPLHFRTALVCVLGRLSSPFTAPPRRAEHSQSGPKNTSSPSCLYLQFISSPSTGQLSACLCASPSPPTYPSLSKAGTPPTRHKKKKKSKGN